MSIKFFDRGATVRITVRFLDADDEATTPDGANAYVNYEKAANGARHTDTVALSQVGDDWVGEWDSRVARACEVKVHARTTGDTPISAKDASFRLQANYANPSS